MTVTFENDNYVIVYALEKIISYARRTQQIFVAHCVWWLACVLGLGQGLLIQIDNLRKREEETTSYHYSGIVHLDRVQHIVSGRAGSSTPSDLTEDQRLDRVLESAEECLAESERIRNIHQHNQVNPLPQFKTHKKARKVKRLQQANKKQEDARNQRLQEIRATVIKNLSQD
jgi:hypothetical protein